MDTTVGPTDVPGASDVAVERCDPAVLVGFDDTGAIFEGPDDPCAGDDVTGEVA